MPIPKIIHQIWLDKKESNNQSPPQGRYTGKPDTLQKMNPEFNYMFWNMDGVRALFQDPELKKFEPFFDSVNYWIQKCDIARLLAVYVHGGVYIDLDVDARSPLDKMIDGKDIVFVHDVIDTTKGSLQIIFNLNRDQTNSIWNGCFAASRRHPIILQLLEYLFNNYAPKKEIMLTTGPGAWGLAAKRFGFDFKTHPEYYIDNCYIFDVDCSHCANKGVTPFLNRSILNHQSTWSFDAQIVSDVIETNWSIICVYIFVLCVIVFALVIVVRYVKRKYRKQQTSMKK